MPATAPEANHVRGVGTLAVAVEGNTPTPTTGA
jgi:hypothetical protein